MKDIKLRNRKLALVKSSNLENPSSGLGQLLCLFFFFNVVSIVIYRNKNTYFLDFSEKRNKKADFEWLSCGFAHGKCLIIIITFN